MMSTSITLKFLSLLISITPFQMSLAYLCPATMSFDVFQSFLLKALQIYVYLEMKYCSMNAPNLFSLPIKDSSDSSLPVFLLISILSMDLDSLIVWLLWNIKLVRGRNKQLRETYYCLRNRYVYFHRVFKEDYRDSWGSNEEFGGDKLRFYG